MPQILSICTYVLSALPSSIYSYEEIRNEHWHILGEWLMICGLYWFGSFLCVVQVERVQLIGYKLAAFLWADRLAKLIRGNIHGLRSLTWVHQGNYASAPSGIPWGALEYAISKNLSHTIPNDPLPCLNDSSGMRSANTLVTGKKNKQTHPSTWSNLLQLSLSSDRTKILLTRQRE